MPIPHRGVAELRRISPDAEADIHQVTELPVPVLDEGRLDVESGRRSQEGLGRRRSQRSDSEPACCTCGHRRCSDEVAPVDLVLIVHGRAPCTFGISGLGSMLF